MGTFLAFFGFMFMLLRFGLRTVGEKGYKNYINEQYEKKKKYIEEHASPELEHKYYMQYGLDGNFRELYYFLLSSEDKIKAQGTKRDKIVYDLWKLESGVAFRLKKDSAQEQRAFYESRMTPEKLDEYYKKIGADEFYLTNKDYNNIVLAEHNKYEFYPNIKETRPMYLLLSLHGKVSQYQAECDARDLFDDKRKKDIKRYGYLCLQMVPGKQSHYGVPEFEGIDEKFPKRYPEMFV